MIFCFKVQNTDPLLIKHGLKSHRFAEMFYRMFQQKQNECVEITYFGPNSKESGAETASGTSFSAILLLAFLAKHYATLHYPTVQYLTVQYRI